MLVDLFSDYTLLKSLLKIEDMVSLAKEKGWKYLGIADDNAGGLLDFYLACSSAGIKPILGMRFYITDDLHKPTIDQVLLYAKNEAGYRALLKLSTRANIEGYLDKPNLLAQWITPDYAKNLLCVLPIGESPVESKTEETEIVIKHLKQVFGKTLYFGLYDRDCGVDDLFLNRAKQTNIPYLPLSGARYFNPDDLDAFKTLRAIGTHTKLDYLFETVYLDESVETAAAKAENIPNHCKAKLDEFVGLIDINIPTPGLKVPKFKIPSQYKDSYEYLLSLCRKGYKQKQFSFRTAEEKKACANRMKIELDVIKRCELADYFLLVYDICKYCDENNIPRGISRGSCGGCLVAYLLDISRVNPLSYGLLFERFLNEDRTRPVDFNGEKYLTDAPDIDLDVGQIQRQQIVDFLRNEYGNVAKIATYTSLSAKACVKDVIRAFGRSEGEANQLSSCIEILFGRSDSLSETYKKSERFKKWADGNKKIYEIALKMEGTRKNKSIHAAGLVISNENIEDRAPLFLANYDNEGDFKKDVCIGYSLEFASKAGLLKVDLLGLRCLNVLQDAVNLIPK